MKIVIDANIVFSGLLNSNGRIGDLLINSNPYFSFIAPDFLRTEIYKHYDKLLKVSKLTLEQLLEAEYHIYKSITFVSEEQISDDSWAFANELVSDIDPKDIVYVAFSRQFDCKLWTGDKKLINGLAPKKYHNIWTTDDLFFIKSNKLFFR
ncbi:MAG: PIN domain-containing protein [Marinilabiliaceae bacterium]|nr:PIN domain-containing protein [Marinilabiliaceae bacterium]